MKIDKLSILKYCFAKKLSTKIVIGFFAVAKVALFLENFSKSQ